MRRKFLIAFLISVLILVSAAVYLFIFNQSYIKTKIFRNVSSAEIFIQDSLIKISFQIADEDKTNSLDFSNALGVNPDWIEGISIALDSSVIDKIKQNLPMNVNLKFGDKELDLNSSLTTKLDSSLPIQNYQIVSGPGKLILNTNDAFDIDLNVVDPGAIIEYATSSGKLYLSSKLKQLFPMISKIAKIRLIVRNKSLTGQILLKKI